MQNYPEGARPSRYATNGLYRAIQPQESTGAPLHLLMCHCEEALPTRQSRSTMLDSR